MADMTFKVAANDADPKDITPSEEYLAADLASAADILAEHGFRLAYESLCWATRAPCWKDGWRLVLMANRGTIGLCIDTFHMAALEWAGPTTTSRLREEPEMLEAFKASLKTLSETVREDRI